MSETRGETRASDERRVRLTAKLYEVRDQMRRLHGEKYAERIGQISPYINGYMQQHACGPLEAGLALAKDASGIDAAMILTAAVEACEAQP